MTQIDELRSSATLYASLFHEANGESNGYGGYCWSCQNREVKYLLTSFVRYEGNYRTCGFPVKRTAVSGVPLFGANCPVCRMKKIMITSYKLTFINNHKEDNCKYIIIVKKLLKNGKNLYNFTKFLQNCFALQKIIKY